MKAGVLPDLSRLRSTSRSARVKFSGGKTTVIDGPFAETKEVIGGYWLIKANSLQEAVAWARRAPAPHGLHQDGEIEVRPLFEMEDFRPSEAAARAKRLGEQLAKKKGTQSLRGEL